MVRLVPNSFTLQLPGNTYISDLRFPSVSQSERANYIATNWPTIEQVAPTYQKEKSASSVAESSQTSVATHINQRAMRMIIYLVAGASTFLLAIFLIKLKLNKGLK